MHAGSMVAAGNADFNPNFLPLLMNNGVDTTCSHFGDVGSFTLNCGG
jgi:hypothetical protein